MAKTLLVTVDVPAGARALQVLDEAGLKPSVAMWAYLGDYEDWRLLVASREFDASSRHDAYMKINKAIRSAGFGEWQTPQIMIMSMTDAFIRQIRKQFGKAASLEGMRLGEQSIGGRYIEDAYVYRIV